MHFGELSLAVEYLGERVLAVVNLVERALAVCISERGH